MVNNSNSDPLAPRELDAQREAISQLARRVRYLETLPWGSGGDERQEYAKEWMGVGGTQIIPTGVDTILYFTEVEKTMAAYVTEAAAPYTRLTVPSGLDGPHVATAGVVFEGQPEGQRRLWIRINGEDQLVAMRVDAASGYFVTELNVSAPDWIWEGYYVEAMVWQNTGGDLLVGRVD